MAIPVIAAVMVVGALAPAFAANQVNINFNDKAFSILDGDLVVFGFIGQSTEKGAPAENTNSYLVWDFNQSCFDFGSDLPSNELRISQGSARLNTVGVNCGAIDLLVNGVGPVETLNESETFGDPDCNTPSITFSKSTKFRQALVSGSIGAAEYDGLDGILGHGVNSGKFCAPNP